MILCQLVAFTPHPEEVVAAAARLCYSPSGIQQIQQKQGRPDIERLIRHLRQVRHFSPFEHASFTFAVEGVSRALSHQLVRHRIASYSQQSQRYVDEAAFDFIMPPSIVQNPAARDAFMKAMEEDSAVYRRLVELGVPREDARYILPNACETKVVVTMNARALLNFFEHRACQRAQWEIRQLAGMMLHEVRKEAPVLFEVAGPPCETEGVCREGSRSCGRMAGVLPAVQEGKGS